MNLSKRNILFLAMALFVLGLSMAIYFHWPALTHYAIYKSDIRQSPHWAAYHTTSFRSDDILVQYGSFNESPLQNLIYYVATFFGDMVTITKILSVLSYGFATVLFFIIGMSLFGMRGGILAALFFAFFPDQFDYSAGFFSKYWMIPLLITCIWILKKERWKYLTILLPLSSLAYPPATVLLGMTVLVYTILVGCTDRIKVRAIAPHLVAGALCALILLLIKYIHPPSFIGPMTAGEQLLKMPEMYSGGLVRSAYLPIPSLFHELVSHLLHPFVLLSALGYFLILGIRGVAWDKTWTALFIASVICYLLSDYFFMRLYIPNRYTRYSMAVILILWNARNCDYVLARISRTWIQITVFILIMATAGYAYRDNFNQQRNAMDRRRYAPLCEFIGQLPEKILVAGPPRYMDDITVQSKRSVLCNYKMAHPWFTQYYREIKERTLATFRAIYATDIGPVNELHKKYGVTHLVVGRSYFCDRLRRKNIYVKPYNDYILKIIGGKRYFLLQAPPHDSVVYRDSRYSVIRLPLKKVNDR